MRRSIVTLALQIRDALIVDQNLSNHLELVGDSTRSQTESVKSSFSDERKDIQKATIILELQDTIEFTDTQLALLLHALAGFLRIGTDEISLDTKKLEIGELRAKIPAYCLDSILKPPQKRAQDLSNVLRGLSVAKVERSAPGSELDSRSKVYIAGHKGMVGSAILRKLKKEDFSNIITRSREELDLVNQEAVRRFFEEERPEYVFLAAAKVGGILAHSLYPVDFGYNNLMIEANVMHCSHEYGVKKLLFVSAATTYPQHAPQPLKEDYLFTGPLEDISKMYSIAKIAGTVLCQSLWQQYEFHAVSIMPNNLYGPNDNYNLEHAHVIPALTRRFHDAKESGIKEVLVWGSGQPRREFLYVDDFADASLFLMKHYESEEAINVGVGQDISIADLAELIAKVVEYKGKIIFDRTKPDGTARKLLDVTKLNKLGWEPKIDLEEGLKRAYTWFLENWKQRDNGQLAQD